MAQSILKSFIGKIQINGGTDIMVLADSFSSQLMRNYSNHRLHFSPTLVVWPRSNHGIGMVHRIRGGLSKYSNDSTSIISNGNNSVSVSGEPDNVKGRCSGREFLGMTDEQLMRQCKMDTLKSSGPGGQHRNKRESAVRLKHLPLALSPR
ncbi:unnamed protein product [Thlaspi arvense]|uniref:Uncharacterized protein n=1 Tax=Thlaspi arvense TaxID=13288 RepID=A0AAU9T8K1_THLAR|nr:unnamed protein product [Thlaspi arvense]